MEDKLKFRSFTSIILLFFTYSPTFAQNFKREKQGVSFAKFVKTSSVKLDALKLANLKVSRVGECTFECISNQDCYSVNFAASLDGKRFCELLGTDKFRQSQHLVESREFDHCYIKVSKFLRFHFFIFFSLENIQ